MVPRREGRGVRRLGGVQGSHRGAARPRPPCAGPVPRHQMVPSRPDRCAPRRAASPRRLQTGIRSRSVPIQVLAHASARQARRGRAVPARRAVRRPPAAQSSMGRARRAAPALSRRRPRGRPRSAARRRTMQPPSKRSTGSPTSTAPATYPSSATPSTHSSPGTSRSSTGTKRDGPATAESTEPTTCTRVLRRRAHGFTNYANFEARGLLLT